MSMPIPGPAAVPPAAPPAAPIVGQKRSAPFPARDPRPMKKQKMFNATPISAPVVVPPSLFSLVVGGGH